MCLVIWVLGSVAAMSSFIITHTGEVVLASASISNP